jgi:protein-tyrosine phosphatase
MDEIREKSSSYAKALEQGMVPVEVRRFPIHDYSSPDDDRAFADTVTEVAASLRAGRRALIHYGAGIGRTGLFAVATLMALGLPTVAARRRVKEAGSGPERQVQEAALERVAQFLCLDQA